MNLSKTNITLNIRFITITIMCTVQTFFYSSFMIQNATHGINAVVLIISLASINILSTKNDNPIIIICVLETIHKTENTQ